MTSVSFPFLSAYDPVGTSEGTLDPLGLYQIADQLAVQLVPGVRERMQRVRFLTAMAVGALLTENIDDDPRNRDASPYLVWEWLLVEAFVRARPDDAEIWGVPGTLVGKRAIHHHNYLDARSYLKTPRIFGFHGVYKRLAIHVGVLDVHLRPRPAADALADAWARGLGVSGLRDAKGMLDRWTAAVRRSAAEKPPRTKPGWANDGWDELAAAFAPGGARAKERRCLERLLHEAEDRPVSALPALWRLQEQFTDETFHEEGLHKQLAKAEPSYVPLLTAIRKYEAFARSLQDAFDVLRAEAARADGQGFVVPDMRKDKDFETSVTALDARYAEARQALGEISVANTVLQNLFANRFDAFAEPMDLGACALALCAHHERVQRAKSLSGKRAWFDRLGKDRIYLRHAYRVERPEIQPLKYVHEYRGLPIRRFRADLS